MENTGYGVHHATGVINCSLWYFTLMYTVYKEKNDTLLYLSTARSTSSFYYDFNRRMHVSYPPNMLKELELVLVL